MSLLVLAYPSISKIDFDWIQSYRKANDKLYYNLVDPHFTIVFPVDDKTEKQFVNEIEKQIASVRKIEFQIKSAAFVKDNFSEYYLEFLIPDLGHDQIVSLHDRLYSEALISNLRLDIAYMPHITVGNSLDINKSKMAIAELNDRRLSITGQINSLTVVKYESGSIVNLATFTLK
jgi:2'-5' RNA ligase